MSITKKEKDRVSVSRQGGDAISRQPTTSSSLTSCGVKPPIQGSFATNIENGEEASTIFSRFEMVSLVVAVLAAAVGCKNRTLDGLNPWAALYLSILMLILNRGWQRNLSSAVRRVCSSDDFKNETQKLSSTIKRMSSKQCWEGCLQTSNNNKTRAVSVISADEPFAPIDDISQLTLDDITAVFQCTMECNTITTETSPLLKRIFEKMDAAVHMSHGAHVIEPKATCASFGDMDALRFCAAVRIYAEWRSVRQVPDGYKSYAVGMNLGRRDIVQNLSKMEHAVHSWIDVQKESNVTGPTLRELLQHEIDLNTHKNLPCLKDKTAAMGLLWVVRQLQYQTCIYANLSSQDKCSSSSQAVSAAYAQVYDKYHGWTVKKMFNYSFKGAPPAEEIFNFMNPTLLEQVTERAQEAMKVQQQEQQEEAALEKETIESQSSTEACSETDDESFQFVSDDESDDDDWEEVPNLMETSFLSEMSFLSDSDDDFGVVRKEGKDKNPFVKFGQGIADGWNEFGKNVERGWNGFCTSIVNVFDKDGRRKSKRDEPRSNMLGGSNEQRVLKKTERASQNRANVDDVEAYISREMAADARRHITAHLKAIEPMVQALTDMMEELNMNDPTKV